MALIIGEVARATGVAAKTIRYYEEVGVLPAPSRTATGYRQYTEQNVQQLLFIRRARALGLPLQRLKPLIATLNGAPGAALRPHLLEVVRAHLSAIRRQIGELRLLQRELEQVLTRRMPPPGKRGTGCRCFERDDVAARPARRRALRTTDRHR